jgi:PAS domain S-box-containing protein
MVTSEQSSELREVDQTGSVFEAAAVRACMQSVLVLGADREGRIRYLNPAGEALTGYSSAEVLGRDWIEALVPDEEREDARRSWTAWLSSGEPESREVRRLRTRAGAIRSVSWRRMLETEGEGAEGVLCLGWDVTDLDTARERLRASEERHRTLLASLPQRIFVKDQQGVFVSVNDAFAADFGRRAAEFVGKTDYDLFAPELAEKYREDDRRVIETGRTETIIETNVVKGKPRYVEVVKAPVVTSDGSVLGVIGVFTDITERRLIEQELARERDLLHILMDNIPDQIYFKDRESRFTRVNRASATALGLESEVERWGAPTPSCSRPTWRRSAWLTSST